MVLSEAKIRTSDKSKQGQYKRGANIVGLGQIMGPRQLEPVDQPTVFVVL